MSAEQPRGSESGQNQAALRVAPDDDTPTSRRVRNALRVSQHLLQCGDTGRAAEMYLKLAEHYAEAGALQQAVAMGYLALRVDPSRVGDLAAANVLRRIGRPALRLCLATVQSHLRADRIEAAIRVAEVMVEIDPDDDQVRCDLAELYLEARRPESAVELLYARASDRAAAGNDRSYVRIARRILRIDAQHPPTLRGLAMACLRLGELDAAIATIDVLLRADPCEPLGLQILARVNVELGRLGACFDALRRLVAALQQRGEDAAAQALLTRASQWSSDPVHQRRLVALKAGLEVSRQAASEASSPATPVVHLSDLSSVPDASCLTPPGRVAAAE